MADPSKRTRRRVTSNVKVSACELWTRVQNFASSDLSNHTDYAQTNRPQTDHLLPFSMESDPEIQNDALSSESEPEVEEVKPKSALKKTAPAAPVVARPQLPDQPDPKDLDASELNPLTPYIIARQGRTCSLSAST